MGMLGDMIVRIKADTGQFTQSLQSTDKQVKKFAKFIMSGVGIGGAILVFRQLGKVVGDVAKLIGEQEKAEAKLTSAIRATGRESTISMRAIAGLANSLQQTTTYGDEATLSAAAMLQQLADLDEKGLKALIPRVQNFAAAMGVDLETAASLVGKTLGSSTNALSRYGLVVDMSGDKSQKLESLIGALDDKFAGMAETLGKTTTGKLEILRNQFNDLKQELAFEFLPVLNKITSALVDIFKARTSFKSAKEIMEPEGFKEATANIGSALNALEILNAEIARTETLLKTQGRYVGPEKERIEQMKKYREMISRAVPALEAQAKAQEKLNKTSPAPEIKKTTEEIEQLNIELAEWLANQSQIVAGFPTMTYAQLGLTDLYSGLVDELKSREPDFTEAVSEMITAPFDEGVAAFVGWTEYFEEYQQLLDEARKKEEEAERQHQAEMRVIRLAALDTVSAVFGSMATMSSNYYAGLLDNEELTDKERKKILRDQAKKQKAFNLFQAIINTARAIAQALPNIPLSILAGIIGAAQIAAISSQPLPRLARGGKLERPTVVMAGEAGTEWMVPELKLDELGGKIAAAMRNASITNVISNDQPIHMGIYLDGKQLDAHIQRSIGNRKIIVAKESVA